MRLTLRTIQRAAIMLSALTVGGIIGGHPSPTVASPAPVNPREVTIILVDRFDAIPAKARAQQPRAVLIRRPHGKGFGNIILVSAETRPDDLDKAVSQLMTAIRRRPIIDREMRAYVAPARRNPAAGRDRSQATKDLKQLRAAREYQIEGFGRRKAITIRVRAPSSNRESRPLVRN